MFPTDSENLMLPSYEQVATGAKRCALRVNASVATPFCRSYSQAQLGRVALRLTNAREKL